MDHDWFCICTLFFFKPSEKPHEMSIINRDGNWGSEILDNWLKITELVTEKLEC